MIKYIILICMFGVSLTYGADVSLVPVQRNGLFVEASVFDVNITDGKVFEMTATVARNCNLLYSYPDGKSNGAGIEVRQDGKTIYSSKGKGYDSVPVNAGQCTIRFKSNDPVKFKVQIGLDK